MTKIKNLLLSIRQNKLILFAIFLLIADIALQIINSDKLNIIQDDVNSIQSDVSSIESNVISLESDVSSIEDDVSSLKY